MRTRNMMIFALLAVAMTAAAQTASAPQTSPASAATQPQSTVAPPTTMDQVVDRAIAREKDLIKFLAPRTPVVETYLQNLQQDPQLGPIPQDDHYFLGRMDLSDSIDRSDYLKEKDKDKDEGMEKRLLGGLTNKFKFQYQPLGFSWMIYADRNDFDRQHYEFHYVRREFLGDVRCLVFDVTPKKDAGRGRFLGRVWVEDQDFNIVRLNGTYSHPSRNTYYFHMDSWRLNLIPGYWLPSYIYSEEGNFTAGAKNKLAFKAQTRLWGYNLKMGRSDDELTQIRVDSVKDESADAQDASPLAAERNWQQQAEDNVIERLERSGLLAPEGDVDKVLQTVVNNLLITNNIELPRPVRTRVLTTSPLETFSVGNTIVVSRGLIDVLPDEGSLAMVLSHELAHIVLGHNLGSQYAFNDRMLFSDEGTFHNLGFKHIPEEETSADKKAVDMLKASPYAQKLETAGLFLKALQVRAPQLSALLAAHLGNDMAENGTVTRMAALETSAPALDWNKLDQIAALPLGGRVKLNPWDNKVEMVKAQPVAITSARDKMPFEVTPFFPRLSRYNPNAPSGTTVPATTATNQTAAPASTSADAAPNK
ncbi:MAG TPA: M48 family metalloprotease [Terriglobales bacterium]|nr:M48 family metalloprotease [Terriglobales bacterium]